MRRVDVLTLGLAAPSRWNPLYRRWARRRAEENLTLALKALVLLYGADRGGSEISLTIGAGDLEVAARAAAVSEPLRDGGLRIRVDPTVAPPRRFRVLYGTDLVASDG